VLRLALSAVLLSLLLAAAGCGGSEDVAPTAETVGGAAPADTTGPADTSGDTMGDTGVETTGETTGGATGDAEQGKQIFEEQGCGGCHTLSAAGSSGNVGPNLDDAKPSADKVVERVTNGKGAMPSFKDQLDEQEIQDVAAFVSSSAGQ